MKPIHIFIAMIFISLTGVLREGFAGPPAKPHVRSSTKTTPATTPGSKDLNFDDELVESLNRNPFDSLTYLGKKGDAALGHLYRKRRSFRREMKQSAMEMGARQ